jgi:hypothetical protein
MYSVRALVARRDHRDHRRDSRHELGQEVVRAVVRRFRTSDRRSTSSTPYAYQEVFFIGGMPETVKLHHADGAFQVPVQDLTQELVEDPARAELALGYRLGEATGYSDAFDFAEAFRDAISLLPDRGVDVRDWLYTYEVTSIGAEIGGIAGFNRMYVKVRG